MGSKRVFVSVTCSHCDREIADETAWSHKGHTVCSECKPTPDSPCRKCGDFAPTIERARFGIAYARRLAEFSRSISVAIDDVAHAKDQDNLLAVLDKFYDVLQPSVVTPDGSLQGINGALDERYGFVADEYVVGDITAASVLPLARLEFMVEDDEPD